MTYQTESAQHIQPNDVIRGDESLPWRRAKPKLRSRSLQPGERNIEDFPWLRQRDRSLPRQEHVLWGRDKVPIKPWIEEVICLKRTEIRRKLVERGCELERVLLKASQIERREIIRAQIVEHIDLKSVQKYFERGNYATMAEAQMAMTEEILQEYEDTTQLQQQKHEEDMSILELTKEIDALVKKDYDIPWTQQGQVTSVEKSKRSSRKSSRDQRSSSTVQQQQQQQQMQRIQATEETTILRLDKHDELNVQLIQQQQIGVPWARGVRQQLQQQSQQSLSHIEDSNIMSVDRHQMDQIEQQQEVAVAWRRGRQPQQPIVNQQQLQHTEDSTMLSIERNDYMQQQSQMEQMIEQPVAWRRGPKQPQQLQHTEDSTMMSINQSEYVDQSQTQIQMNEQPVAWRRGPKQPQQVQQLQHLEDSNMLDIQRRQSEELQEVPVAWKRGGRKPAPVQQIEQTQADEVQLQDEVAVPWARGQKKPTPVEPQLQEVAVPWARGKKKQQPVVNEPEPIQPVEEIQQPSPVVVAPKKKKPKTKKPTSAQTSVDVEEYADQLPDFERDEQQPDESIVADEVTESGEVEEPQKQFILREVQEIEEVVEKKKVKVRRPRRPEEVAEELAIDDAPAPEQIEPIETERVQETATVEQVDVQKKVVKKKKTKATKQVVFNDEHDVETIEDEAAEVTQSSIQLRQAQVKPTVVQSEETEQLLEQTDEEFRKDIDVKMVSNIVKKDKRRLHIDDSRPLPELELITQKRVQQGIDMVADEEIIEDIVKGSIEESISNTSLPERLLVKKKPVVLKAPRFLKKLQPAVCQPDQPTVLQCKIDGNPYPDVKWFFNDIELFASEKYIFNVTEKVATLEIVRVTPLDVGVYTCQAKNQAGVATSRSNIVLGKFTCVRLYMYYDVYVLAMLFFRFHIFFLLLYIYKHLCIYFTTYTIFSVYIYK